IRTGTFAGRRSRDRRRRAQRIYGFSHLVHLPMTRKCLSLSPKRTNGRESASAGRQNVDLGVTSRCDRFLVRPELGVVQLGVAPTTRQQLIVGAAFDKATALDDEGQGT